MRTILRVWVLAAGVFNAYGETANPHVLTAFVERGSYMPSAEKRPDSHLLKKIEDPRKLHRLIIKGHIQSRAVQGLCASYAGWWTYSDTNGQLSFPLEHVGHTLLVVITRRILPIKAHDGMVKGFFVPPGEPVEAYMLERHANKKQKMSTMWWTVKRYDLPERGNLPADALIIFAKPHHVVVHEGESVPTIVSHNLILPTFYVPYNVNLATDAVYITAVNQYFAPVTPVMVRTPERYAAIIAP